MDTAIKRLILEIMDAHRVMTIATLRPGWLATGDYDGFCSRSASVTVSL